MSNISLKLEYRYKNYKCRDEFDVQPGVSLNLQDDIGDKEGRTYQSEMALA